ncbi:MAG: hypothetical protein ACR2RB_07575 [Gammaproteobacteria bacterium]
MQPSIRRVIWEKLVQDFGDAGPYPQNQLAMPEAQWDGEDFQSDDARDEIFRVAAAYARCCGIADPYALVFAGWLLQPSDNARLPDNAWSRAFLAALKGQSIPTDPGGDDFWRTFGKSAAQVRVALEVLRDLSGAEAPVC